MLDAYSTLGKAADRKVRMLFSGVPKLHWAWHLAERASYVNPRRSANFLDEDFQRLIKKLAQGCTAGRRIDLIPLVMMDKYRHGMDLAEEVFD